MGSARLLHQSFSALFLICLLVPCVQLVVVGKAGTTVELDCLFPPSHLAPSPDSPYVVEWVRQGLDIPVLINYLRHQPRVNPQYEGRVSLVRVTALRLGPLRLEDQGLYECRVLSLDGAASEQQNGTWTLLSVTAPPTLTRAPPPDVEVFVGRPLSLTCVANGNPAPVITWLKDGKVIQTGGVLSVPVVKAESGGQYTCHASSSQGNTSHSSRVHVKGPPVIIKPPKSARLNMSQDALLQCQAVSNPPNMTYVWLKGPENVYHIDALKSRVKVMVDGTLLISRLLPEDSGRYTCMPTNGLLTPPTASANLTVMHPAQALQTPKDTYLPTGKDGLVTCPSVAQPPLLRVEWTKDGEPLDLAVFPGWRLTADGSLTMATVNDDVAGVYVCTPYNSYGSMGPSGPIVVKLQDPPSFSLVPEERYSEEVGGRLLLPCQANNDAAVKVTWSKVDISRRVAYSITSNGSLLLQPLTKEHQGSWECSAANRVASVSTSTQVYVLGTSPHAATGVSVSPGLKEANVSWAAGFDGGSEQTFSVWVKRQSAGGSHEQQEWFSVPVPLPSGTSLQVAGLTPATSYQFSVLSQNKQGTGPFSEIVTAQTLDARPQKSALLPPSALSARRNAAGVVLRWSPPADQSPPARAYVLQSRTDEEEDGEWVTVDEHVSANSSEMVVPGLQKGRVYQLRMLSRRGEMLSEASPSVNVTTVGMDMYPSKSRLLEFGPEPLLAGVLGGVAFMCLALVVLLGVACLISHKRERRRRERDG
ncbi:protein turtle homolog A-like [Eucyclogobius newberryi]|uniref:protein turtle homolog A-like n=1 Tax=Eucyclogobius newberryi TaxID=166745 RepID=UPI003B5BC632